MLLNVRLQDGCWSGFKYSSFTGSEQKKNFYDLNQYDVRFRMDFKRPGNLYKQQAVGTFPRARYFNHIKLKPEKPFLCINNEYEYGEVKYEVRANCQNSVFLESSHVSWHYQPAVWWADLNPWLTQIQGKAFILLIQIVAIGSGVTRYIYSRQYLNKCT